MSGASEVFRLADDFDRAAKEVLPALRGVVQDGMSDIKTTWVSNATASSGEHGKHYPKSITYETRVTAGGIVGEVGPDAGRPQGGMGRGFELGSRNQPPHLDGLRAVEAVTPSMARRFDSAIGYLLP